MRQGVKEHDMHIGPKSCKFKLLGVWGGLGFRVDMNPSSIVSPMWVWRAREGGC